jgi:L-asparagine transporter-like permease
MNHSGKHAAEAAGLKRELGVFGAVMMGMGSILGTGVFVSIGIATGIKGPAVILVIALAAVVATYAITNLAALRIPSKDRLYSPFLGWGGLVVCLFLAFWRSGSLALG